jgi:hypothetical protein
LREYISLPLSHHLFDHQKQPREYLGCQFIKHFVPPVSKLIKWVHAFWRSHLVLLNTAKQIEDCTKILGVSIDEGDSTVGCMSFESACWWFPAICRISPPQLTANENFKAHFKKVEIFPVSELDKVLNMSFSVAGKNAIVTGAASGQYGSNRKLPLMLFSAGC